MPLILPDAAAGPATSVGDDDDAAGHPLRLVVGAPVAERADTLEHHRLDDGTVGLHVGGLGVVRELHVVPRAERDRVALVVVVDPLDPGADDDAGLVVLVARGAAGRRGLAPV